MDIITSNPKNQYLDTMTFCKTRNVKNPLRAHDSDAGIDFFIPDDFPETVIKPGEDITISMGIKINLPKNMTMIFKNKSGIATKQKLVVGACVIDEDYKGELILHLMNVSSKISTTIKPGQKIVQGIIIETLKPKMVEISEEQYESNVKLLLEKDNNFRGSGGFGSTGI